MSESLAITNLKTWIRRHGFPDFDLEDNSEKGTYGLIWFLNAKHQNQFPKSLALKTLDVDKLPEEPQSLDELQREFGKWTRLTHHHNVVTARQFKIAPIKVAPSPEGKVIQLPIMAMERMDGSLQDWVSDKDSPSMETKLSGLAQAFNGLAHLYANGVEGHGDLKPSNLLYVDISKTQRFPKGVFFYDYPSVVKVADFGWADAWIDYGYTNKAFRHYLAPERIGEDAQIVPEKSDIFSMGIVVAEVLQGRHPAFQHDQDSDKELKKRTKSPGTWKKFAIRGEWNLIGITSTRLKEFIISCLAVDPDQRPTATEAVHILCSELKDEYKLDLEPTLKIWSTPKDLDDDHEVFTVITEADRLRRTLGLGCKQEKVSRDRLREMLADIEVKDIASCFDWVHVVFALLDFFESDKEKVYTAEIDTIRADAREYFRSRFGQVDQEELSQVAKWEGHKPPVRSFETFSSLLGGLAIIAGIDFEQVKGGEWLLSPLAVGAYAFDMAARAHAGEKCPCSKYEYLDIAIDQTLVEATPYYVRALWRKQLMIINEIHGGDDIGFTKNDLIADLKIAQQLDSDWYEPREMLKRIQTPC